MSIQQAKDEGWRHLPMITCNGGVVGALIKPSGEYFDLVTLPESGLSEIRRVRGGPSAQRPRCPGDVLFDYQVPVHVALHWVLVVPWNDDFLQEWTAEHYSPQGRSPQ
ncbi:hypothetical protein [Lentzea terrae]|uniref:hypothetical protein n=1 Tax=Lentzea terrae TaxID=2200761 RepID=UPI000DD3FE63|nr:hypothetical protein [Lentzea terrae]